MIRQKTNNPMRVGVLWIVHTLKYGKNGIEVKNTNNKFSNTYNSNTRNINAELSYTSIKVTRRKRELKMILALWITELKLTQKEETRKKERRQQYFNNETEMTYKPEFIASFP